MRSALWTAASLSVRAEEITYENVLSVLGTVDTEDFSALYRAVNNYDFIAALNIIEKTVDSERTFPVYQRFYHVPEKSSDFERRRQERGKSF